MIAFGPIPSRRLGRSLGINHIPPKLCSYACVYCQAGRTSEMRANPRALYDPSAITTTVRRRVIQARQQGQSIDYLTFVPDGEPSLDANLGCEMDLLRPLGIKIAVISNASLIGYGEVRQALAKADWVSLKVDAASESIWRRVNRPHRHLKLEAILEGMLTFASDYRGKLVTETMLVAGVNDGASDVEAVAAFLARLRPAIAYLAIPTRPPVERWVQPPPEPVVNEAYQILARAGIDVECLTGYEGNAFATSGDVESDLLSMTAVHPMREDAVRDLLARAHASWSIVEELVDRQQLVCVDYCDRRFYMRRHSGQTSSSSKAQFQQQTNSHTIEKRV